MTRRRFFDLREGDRIKVYSAGRFEGEGIFIRFTEEKSEDFIYWIKRNGNDCYTSLDVINIEKIRYGHSYGFEPHHSEYEGESERKRQDRQDDY
ncbi:hypothetical protein CBR59_31740 [Bacillus thuringiensis]|uniref:hypothetical protein n=1 Tax=Bacillus thuringiensis TaxID=1428 RepID=UPI000C9DB932|nr:hypothetical protein [Bacillus thuringiensis]PNK22218.1 hypothetical protein CBP87_32100 [Bacillus thuringiensis]PNK44219.1 hypothetical protein CBR59_31740 [Bacillus thuringiensis]